MGCYRLDGSLTMPSQYSLRADWGQHLNGKYFANLAPCPIRHVRAPRLEMGRTAHAAGGRDRAVTGYREGCRTKKRSTKCASGRQLEPFATEMLVERDGVSNPASPHEFNRGAISQT